LNWRIAELIKPRTLPYVVSAVQKLKSTTESIVCRAFMRSIGGRLWKLPRSIS